jgi:hypothetical protein
MIEGHRCWVDLLNAEAAWITDESMLKVIPDEAREFESSADWPRGKALAYLNNNAGALRLNYARLEEGLPLDPDLLNPVLESMRLGLVASPREIRIGAAGRRKTDSRGRCLHLEPRIEADRWNRGTAAVRLLVQRAVYHFAQYIEHRFGDPAYPGASAGMFRVLRCAAPRCPTLLACPTGQPLFCSEACAEDTGRLH